MSANSVKNKELEIQANKLFDKLDSPFLLEDYKQKVAYLTAHLGRMWTRFNFFLTAEVALIAYLFTAAREFTSVGTGLAVIELMISIIWWEFGRQDRFLVLIYREQIEEVVKRLLKKYLSSECPDEQELRSLVGYYRYAGETEKTGDHIKTERDKTEDPWDIFCNFISERRGKNLSITRLAAVVPFIAGLVWLGLLIYFLLRG